MGEEHDIFAIAEGEEHLPFEEAEIAHEREKTGFNPIHIQGSVEDAYNAVLEARKDTPEAPYSLRALMARIYVVSASQGQQGFYTRREMTDFAAPVRELLGMYLEHEIEALTEKGLEPFPLLPANEIAWVLSPVREESDPYELTSKEELRRRALIENQFKFGANFKGRWVVEEK